MTLRKIYIFIAFFIAVIATLAGWYCSLRYKITPVVPLAFWFPLIVITGVHDLGCAGLSLIQFPLFAVLFTFGIYRMSPGRVLAALLFVYALFVGIALIIVKAKYSSVL